MDLTKSKILCYVNALVIWDSLTVTSSFTLIQEYFNEEKLIQYFQEETLEYKQSFFTTYFMLYVFLQNQCFPVDFNLFNQETNFVISLMSQFLGIDTDRYVIEMLMSLILNVSKSHSEPHSSKSVCLKFDELLAESIHSQLVNFHSTKHFRFQ